MEHEWTPATLVRAARHAADVSQRELAQLSGLSATTVSRVESGQTGSPGFLLVQRLVTAIGCRLALLDGEGNELLPLGCDGASGGCDGASGDRDGAGRRFPAHFDARVLRRPEDYWMYAFTVPERYPERTYDQSRVRRDARRLGQRAELQPTLSRVRFTVHVETARGWTRCVLSGEDARYLAWRQPQPRLNVHLDGVVVRVTLRTRNGRHRFIIDRDAIAPAELADGRHELVIERCMDAPVSVPADLADALRADPRAQDRFDTLVETHRRDYVTWLTDAPDPETRRARLAVVITEVSEAERSGRESPSR